MKKLLLSALAICAFTFSNAQEDNNDSTGGFAQGDMFISGSFGFGSTKLGDAKSNNFEIAPKFGYFVNENIAVGAKVGFGSMKEEDAAGNETVDGSSMTLGAFGRYYWTPASKFSVMAELGVDYVSEDNKLVDEGKVNGFNVAVGPGISYFVSNNFAIEAGWGAIQYNTMKSEVSGAEAQNTFGLGLDLTDLNFGLVYKF